VLCLLECFTWGRSCILEPGKLILGVIVTSCVISIILIIVLVAIKDEAWAQVKPEDGWNITYAGMSWKIGHKGVEKLTAERVVKHSVKYNVSPTDIQIVADQLADKD
jgi:hypothetical protein